MDAVSIDPVVEIPEDDNSRFDLAGSQSLHTLSPWQLQFLKSLVYFQAGSWLVARAGPVSLHPSPTPQVPTPTPTKRKKEKETQAHNIGNSSGTAKDRNYELKKNVVTVYSHTTAELPMLSQKWVWR